MNRIWTLPVALVAIATLASAPLQASIIDVTVTGRVSSNGIVDAPLSGVSGGDGVALSFTVDSNNFVDGIPGDTRGYVIDEASFSLAFDTPVVQGLLNPFHPGQTPYFTMVDGFSVSDGFFVSTSPVSPGGVALAQTPQNFGLDLGYTGTTLGSLDILDAIGVYDFTGLTSFHLQLWTVFPDNVHMEIDFEQMTIAIPEPATLSLLALGGLGLLRRRRSSGKDQKR